MKHHYPRVFSTEGRVGIVGEQNYQANIYEVILYDIMVEKEDMDYRDDQLEAVLILDDENPYDPGNAVRVDIDDKTVGYLEKRDAQTYRDTLHKLGAPAQSYYCQASAAGKRESPRKKMTFGIWLAMVPWNIEIKLEPPPRKKLFGIF